MRGAPRPIAFILVLSLALGACRTAVRAGLNEREANQLIVALEAAAIGASKEPDTGARDRYRVEVMNTDAARAIALLEAQHLPRSAEPGLDALYQDAALLATPQEERARWSAATAAELGRTLEHLPGVIAARVHLALPESERALDAPPAELKAAVLVQRARHAPPLDEQTVRNLVAAAIDGLRPERVTVVQTATDTAPPAPAPLVHIGPIAVSRGSALALRALLAATFGLDLLMAIALVVLVRRARGARSTSAQS